MTLTANGCGGGVVLEWSKVADPRFHRYVTLRSTGADVPAAYPPAGGAVELAASRTKDPSATSAPDTTAVPGTPYAYRTLALDAANAVIAVSPVRLAAAAPVQPLGPLSAMSAAPGKTKFAWTPYGGSSACFTYYKLVYSETNPSPSYVNGDPYWAAVGDRAAGSVVVEGLAPGTTYFVRLQAVRSTALGAVVVAQTDVLAYLAP